MSRKAPRGEKVPHGESAGQGRTRAVRGVFVTGTDTGIGKTFVSVALLRALAASGWRAVGMKPVAAGIDPGAAVNEDVEALAAAGNVPAPLAARNPYAFTEPIAPHLAARDAAAQIDLDAIAGAYRALAGCAEAIVVEGAGGALVPLGSGCDMLDVPFVLGLPVLLVVGMRLGCLNHALLTAQAVRARGLRLAGWVANELPPGMPRCADNIATLSAWLGVAPIATVAPGGPCRFDAGTLGALKFR